MKPEKISAQSSLVDETHSRALTGVAHGGPDGVAGPEELPDEPGAEEARRPRHHHRPFRGRPSLHRPSASVHDHLPHLLLTLSELAAGLQIELTLRGSCCSFTGPPDYL